MASGVEREKGGNGRIVLGKRVLFTWKRGAEESNYNHKLVRHMFERS